MVAARIATLVIVAACSVPVVDFADCPDGTCTPTVDTEAPDVTITEKPGDVSNLSMPVFGFESKDQTATFQCQVDGVVDLVACASPWIPPVMLPDGMRTFRVRAIDPAGNRSSDVTHKWLIDRTLPVVTITNKPPDPTNNDSPSIAFTVAGVPISIECRVDTGTFTACSSPLMLSMLDEIPHTVDVRATNANGNSSMDSASFRVDVTAPVVAFTGVPVVTNDTTPQVEFIVSELGVATTCEVSGGSPVGCTSPFTTGPLVDGDYTVTVTPTDAAGNVGQAVTSSQFRIDTLAPTITFTQVPPSLTNDNTPSVAFTISDANPAPGAECRVDTGAFVACDPQTGFTASQLGDGPHSIEVRASDAATNSTSSITMFTIDTVTPVVTLTTVPSNPTNDNTAVVAFTVSGATTIECDIDDTGFAPCASPFVTPPLADTIHTISVRGTDGAGNTDTKTTTFAVDTVAPTVTLTAVPSTPSNDNTPVVTFSTAGAPTTVECKLDTGAFTACTSPFAPGALADGSHTITVKATDAATNFSTASTTFTIDTAAPTVTLTQVPSDPTSDNTPTVTFSTNGAPTTIECQVDATGFVPCTSPFTAGSLGDGAHSIAVKVTDAATNSSQVTTLFTVDTVAPTVTLTAVPPDPTNDSTPAVSFSTAGAPTAIECRVDTGAFAACTSPFVTSVLADGSHTITVRVTDAATNFSTASTTFTVDTVAPTVTLTQEPPDPTNDNTPTVAFSTAGAPTTIECQVDATSFVPCASPFTAGALGDGAHSIRVRVTDAATNSSQAASTFTVDTIAPAITFDTVPASPSSDNTPTLSFTVSGQAVTIECAVDAGAFAACTSPFTATTVADGSHTISVRATDAASNATTKTTASFVVDTTPPTVTLNTVPTDPTADNTATVTFTATDATAVAVECRVDAGAFAPCTSPFTSSALVDGSHTITVRATDAVGLATSKSTVFTVDTTAPVVTLDGPPPAWPVDYFDIEFAATDTTTTTAECNLNNAGFSSCTSPHTISTSYGGISTFEVRVTDAVGFATTKSATWTSTAGLVLHYPWEQGDTVNTSLLAQSARHSPNGSVATLPAIGGWAGTAAASPATHTYTGTDRALSSSPNDRYTSSVWIRINATTTGTIWSNQTANGGMRIALLNGTTLRVSINPGDVGVTFVGVDTGRWVQVATRSNGAGQNSVTLWLDGEKAGTISAPPTSGFGAGQAADLTVGPLPGVDIDDLRLHNKTFTDAEMCTVVARGVIVGPKCVANAPQYELDFEQGPPFVNTGVKTLTVTGPTASTLEDGKLGERMRITNGTAPLQMTGFANAIAGLTEHSLSLWFKASVDDLLVSFAVPCPPIGPEICGLVISYEKSPSQLRVFAGTAGIQTNTTIPVTADVLHNVVVAEQRSGNTTTSIKVFVDGGTPTTINVGSGDLFANVSDTVTLSSSVGMTVDEHELWPRDLSADSEMLCENGFDGEFDPATATCALTSN